MSTMTGISVSDFVSYGGVTGSATTAQINIALQMAWNDAEDFIHTQLYPYTVSAERHPWPANGRVMLNYSDLVSVTTVTARHDEQTCDCDVTDVSGCSVIFDLDMSIIDVKECYRQTVPCSSCACSHDGKGTIVLVTYIAGLSHPLPDRIKLALTLLAKDYLAVMTGGLDEFAQLKKVRDWHSMSYGESYSDSATPKKGRLEAQTRAEMAWNLLANYRRKRAIAAFTNPRRSGILGA